MGRGHDLCNCTAEQASVSKFNQFHFHFCRLQIHRASDTKGGTQRGQIISPCFVCFYVLVSWWGGIRGKITAHNGSQLMTFMLDGHLGSGHVHFLLFFLTWRILWSTKLGNHVPKLLFWFANAECWRAREQFFFFFFLGQPVYRSFGINIIQK